MKRTDEIVRTSDSVHSATVVWAGFVTVFLLEGFLQIRRMGPRLDGLVGPFFFVCTTTFAGIVAAIVPTVLGFLWGALPRGSARSRRVRAALIALAAFGAALWAYRVGHSEIERGILFIRRRIDPEIPYDLDPAARPLTHVAAWLILPTLVLAWAAARTMALGDRLRYAKMGLRVTLAAACLSLMAVVLWVDESRYVNLYRLIHGALSVAAVAFGVLSWALFPSSWTGALARRLFGAVGFVFVATSALALGGLHGILENRWPVEALVYQQTNLTRETLFLLRRLADRDGDGAPAVFGGDDADDEDPLCRPGRFEVAGNGFDENGFEGDLPLSQTPAPAAPLPRPRGLAPVDSVILITIDALRVDRLGRLGADGKPLTPHIDALASQGVQFANAFSHASYTVFCFGSIWSSWLPYALTEGKPEPTWLPRYLNEAGIDTAGIATSFFGRVGVEKAGFLRLSTDIDDARNPRTASLTLSQAFRELESPRGKRFLWVHFFDVHGPYVPEHAPSDPSPQALYDAEVRATDAAIGRLLDAVQAPGGPRTAIVLTADHGEEFGEHDGAYHGSTLYGEVTHIPFIIKAPGLPRRVETRLVKHIDIAPTVTDLLGLPPSPDWMGRSVLTLASGESDPGFDHGVMSMTETGLLSLIEPEGRWKIITHRALSTWELYDLQSDPGEIRNLARPSSEKLRSMRRRLERREAAVENFLKEIRRRRR